MTRYEDMVLRYFLANRDERKIDELKSIISLDEIKIGETIFIDWNWNNRFSEITPERCRWLKRLERLQFQEGDYVEGRFLPDEKEIEYIKMYGFGFQRSGPPIYEIARNESERDADFYLSKEKVFNILEHKD